MSRAKITSSLAVVLANNKVVKGKKLPLILQIMLFLEVIKVRDESYPMTGLSRPLGLQEVEATGISRQSAHEGSKVVSPTHQPSKD
jgi:hypothetical protein